MTKSTLTFTLALFCALFFAMDQAWAQKGGGGGGKPPPSGGGSGGGNGGGNGGGRGPGTGGAANGNNNNDKQVTWVASLEAATDSAKTGEKYIFYYVYPPSEVADPVAFHTQEIVDASTGNWVFTKKQFDKEDAELKKLKVTEAPMMIGMDKFGNPFPRTSTINTEQARGILKATPAAVEKFKKDIAADWSKAGKALDSGDEQGAIRPMVEIVAPMRHGYDEIESSYKKLREIGDKRLAAIDEQAKSDAAAASKALAQMASDFKGSPTACDVEIRLARADREKENVAGAIVRLQKVALQSDDHYKDQVASAKKLLDEIVADGLTKVDRASQLASAGETDQAKNTLRKLQNDYKGTEVARRAGEALKAIE